MTSRYFVAFCLPNPAQPPDVSASSQFGFTCPRALGKAVARNRIKRRMREAVRREMPSLPAAWKFVFNPRRGVLDAPFDDLCREIGRIFARCKQS